MQFIAKKKGIIQHEIRTSDRSQANFKATSIQKVIFRYCFVGGFATVVDWALSSLLFYLVFSGSGYAALCNGLSFVAGLLVNYFLSTFWIFKQSKMQNRFLEFLSFAAIGVVGLLLTIGITKGFAWALADVTSLYQILSKVVSTAVAFFWNFFARKYLLYTKKEA